MSKKNLSKPLNIFFIILAICLLLVFLNSRNFLDAPERALSFIFSPVAKLFQKTSATISGSLNFISTIKNINNENNELKIQNASFLRQIIELKEVARENEFFRQQLNLQNQPKMDLVFAGIVGFDPLKGQYFIIDKGSDNGLQDNQAAVDANDFFVGKVFDVQKTSAKVLLLTDSSCMVNALTQENRINGIIKGEHGLDIIMDMIPLDKQIKKDEPVITSGLDNSIPKGLLIGWVSDVVSKENEVFQKVKIKPAADFKKLENIFIIK